jgi:hypothetical protein
MEASLIIQSDWRHIDEAALTADLGGETAAEGILRDSARQDELQQVIGSTRLRADARHFEAAEWLAIDQGTRDLAINIEIANAELTLDAGNVRRAARE